MLLLMKPLMLYINRVTRNAQQQMNITFSDICLMYERQMLTDRSSADAQVFCTYVEDGWTSISVYYLELFSAWMYAGCTPRESKDNVDLWNNWK